MISTTLISLGQSIKYVTLFLAIFNPPVTLCHTPRDPPPKKVRHTSRTPHIFSRPSTKNPDKNLCRNSLAIVRGVFSRGLSLEGFVRGGFCLFPFGQNTSVTIES